MVNKNILTIDINQKLTFSKLFAKTQKSNNIFLPGCALNSLGPQIITSTHQLLKKQIPDLALSTFCCGKPSTHINNGKDFAKRFAKLEQSLKKNQVKQIITACPNCHNLLKEQLKDIKITSIYQILDKIIKQGQIDYSKRQLILHDPCTTRNLPLEHQAIRNLLTKMNINIIEFKHTKDKTICCGQKNMLMVLDNQKAMKVLKNRVKQAQNHTIVSYCAACVQAFKFVDQKSVHILELILDIEGNYSWKNRLAIAQKIIT